MAEVRYVAVTEVRLVYDENGNALFPYNGKIYNLSNFLRAHNNPWISDNFPDYIHGFNSDYCDEVYVGIEDDERVVVYERELN